LNGLEVDFALLNPMLVNLFTVLSRSQPPVHDTPFVKAKGGDNRLDRTAMAKQSNNEGHPGLGGLQPVKRRPLGLGKSLSTPDAQITPFFSTMHSDIALSHLTSGRTSRVMTKLSSWVHRLFSPNVIFVPPLKDALWTP
jgi:hypothetical protein